jgi:hypothetical protein
MSRANSGSNRWYRTFEDVPAARSIRTVLILWVAALAIGALFYFRGHRTLGAAICAVSSPLTVAAAASSAAHRAIQRFFRAMGGWLGRAVSAICLGPIFFVGLPVVRLFRRLSGSDPLYRRAGYATLWQESAAEERKRRVIGDTFAAERFRTGSSVMALAAGLVLLLMVVELAARLLGLGTPVLYVIDPVVGYYPAPDQHLARFRGARVETNHFGMRAPDYSEHKPAGVFRILALGDSTLWGTSSVDQDEIYARGLERLLRAKYLGGEVQILNIAANNWGPFHELGYVEKFGTFEADLAMICLPTRDLSRPKYGLENLPFFSTNYKPRLALEEELRHLAWRYIGTTVGTYSDEGRKYQEAQGVKAYAELTGRLQKQGIEVIVEVLPWVGVGYSGTEDATETGLVEQLRSGLAPLGVEVDYPQGLFQKKGPQGEIYLDDIHLNSKGNAIYAEYLEGRVVTRSRKLAGWAVARGGGKP